MPKGPKGKKADADSGASALAPPKGWKARAPSAAERKALEARIAKFEAQRALEAEAAIAKLWSATEPQMVKGADGQEYPLTFSNDSEIVITSILRALEDDPAALQQIHDLFPQPLPAAEWARALKISETKLRQFGLRKGVDKKQAEYSRGELSFEHFANLSYASPNFTDLAATLVQARLRQKNLPVRVGVDAVDVEVRHEASEMIPKTFAAYITRLHQEIEAPRTQLHVGLPTAAITHAQAVAIARAAETKTLIALAAASPDEGRPLKHTDSSLKVPLLGSRSTWFMTRGPVYLKPSEFTVPVWAHDLEIRQWTTLEQGMDVLATTVALAKNAGRLRVADRPAFGAHDNTDFYWGNITGALEYAGAILKASPTEARRQVAEGLEALVAELTNAAKKDRSWRITKPMRAKIHKFLNRQKVYDLLDAEAFLVR